MNTMTRKEITYELFINANIRYKNIINYMNISKDYSESEINALYESGQSKELDLSFLLGTLIMNDKTSSNHSKYISQSKDQSKFRAYLVKQLNASTSNKIKTIFKNQSISLENIKLVENPKTFEAFSPKRFLELIVSKRDLKIIRFFNKQKVLNEKEMKDFIST